MNSMANPLSYTMIWRYSLFCTLLSVLLLFQPNALFAQETESLGVEVRIIELRDAIGPASADYTIRALQRAAEEGAAVAVLRMDTPGGLDMAMRDIINAILESPIPVVTWVAPSGARAASAGTFIAYASHFAAMAPATNIGSATPVSMGGGGGSPFPDAPEQPEQPGEADEEAEEQPPRQDGRPMTDMERKVLNDAVAYIRGLAELRGRNADWAEEAVRDASNLSASEALETNVINLIAGNVTELLEGLGGLSYEIDGVEYTLDLDNANVVNIEPDWRHEFLSVITNPNVAYILLMIGIYGLILEFYNPGMGVPGITGVICLLVAGFALQMLPISYAGLALMVVGLTLMMFEVFSPSFGVFGVGGLIAFVLGSIMLMDTDVPGYQVSMPLIAAIATATGGALMITLGALLKSRQHTIASGAEAMVGSEAIALENFDRKGHVQTHSETWTAVCDAPVKKGDELIIERLDGLILHVRKTG